MRFFRLSFAFLRDIYKNRFVIWQLTKRDYKNRYIGSFLGFIWTIIQPFVLLIILWLVFTKGFNAGPVNGIPFIAWFAIGLISWDIFATVLPSTTGVFQEYSYLVKKINFRIAILPIVKLLSFFFIHLITLTIGIIILYISGITISLYWVQIIYYWFALIMFLLGLSWILSSLQVFIRDIAQIVSVILQFGFWFTPIVWSMDLLPEKYHIFLKLNPIFYIVDGYRKTFIFHEPFWNNYQWTIYFWSVTLVILLTGVFLFRKLRPHFADVL